MVGGAEPPPTGVAASVASTFGKTLAARETTVQGLLVAPDEQKPGGNTNGRSLHIIRVGKKEKKKTNPKKPPKRLKMLSPSGQGQRRS